MKHRKINIPSVADTIPLPLYVDSKAWYSDELNRNINPVTKRFIDKARLNHYRQARPPKTDAQKHLEDERFRSEIRAGFENPELFKRRHMPADERMFRDQLSAEFQGQDHRFTERQAEAIGAITTSDVAPVLELDAHRPQNADTQGTVTFSAHVGEL